MGLWTLTRPVLGVARPVRKIFGSLRGSTSAGIYNRTMRCVLRCTRFASAIGVVGIVIVGPTASAIQDAPPQTNAKAAALAEFDDRVKAYMAVHLKATAQAGDLDPTKTPQEITGREIALGKLIQAARSGATRGELFTPAAEQTLKEIIRAEFKRRPAPVRVDRRQDQDELADFTPRVNQVYPPTSPLVTFPAGLLRALPKLPPELEYRLVQRNLILRDIEANLIIDFIPAATP